jgi:hypothetical protein
MIAMQDESSARFIHLPGPIAMAHPPSTPRVKDDTPNAGRTKP